LFSRHQAHLHHSLHPAHGNRQHRQPAPALFRHTLQWNRSAPKAGSLSALDCAISKAGPTGCTCRRITRPGHPLIMAVTERSRGKEGSW
jgi:hypothetical protein